MKKIMIIGLSGSGKSTLAETLAGRHGLPVYHLDRYYWMPGWVEIDQRVFKEVHAALVSQECWIIEGNSMQTFNERVDAADTIIYLDLPRVSCLWRVAKRRFFCSEKDCRHRPCGCQEKLTNRLVLYLLWHFRRIHHPRIVRCLALARQAGKKVIVLQSLREIKNFQL